jgi:hypothetical protein
VQKLRNRLVIFALATAGILSCGIPTSMPILPKEVAIKGSPSLSVPLGRVNYNLYSGINGETMNGKLGSLDNLLGASWLQDLLDQGVKVYDYRPSGSEDDVTQKFLLHYKLDMEDTMGSAGEFDLSEYRDMLDELTGDPTKIDDVSFAVPSVDMTEPFDVEISLDQVTGQIFKNIDSVKPYIAYLPVTNGSINYDFPDDISALPENSLTDFSVALNGLDSLALKDGKLNFKLALTSLPPQGSTLTLSSFTLRANGRPVPNITGSSGSVTLASYGATGSASIFFKDAELPQKFELVCMLRITGNSSGFFELEVTPAFEDFTISGVKDLLLTADQIASLNYNFPETIHPIGGGLGNSFKAIVETGNLEIDTAELFPALDSAKPGAEGWNLAMNLSELYVKQNPSPGYTVNGLSLGGPSQPLRPGSNNLHGETLNNQDVIIDGKVTMGIASGGNKLTFRNFPGGIKKGVKDASYKKRLDVNLNVSLFSTVTVLAEDFGLDKIDQKIERELGDDFTSFKPWLNHIQFEEGGLGTVLTVEKLNIADGLGLYIDAPAFGLHHVFQPLENCKDPATGKDQENARLTFTNKGRYKLTGEELPGSGETLSITVKLGLEDAAAQKYYEETGLLTIKNVVPGEAIELTDLKAALIFDWTAMSIKPKPHLSGGSDDPLPDYPFRGTYPDKDKGEEGIDLSGIPTGLVFHIPDRGAEDGEGMGASLYISLKRQQLVDGDWTDEAADDPDAPGYDEKDPNGWRRNLRINLPNLDFRVRYGDNDTDVSENLFTYNPNEEKDTGEWTLSRPLDLEDPDLVDQELVKADGENADNPFKIYSGASLPEPDKAIAIGNLAEVFNKNLIGAKDLYFEYTVELSSIPDNENGLQEPGEIMLYPDMLKKRVLVSADLLIVLPLKFKALQTDPDAAVPVVVTIAPDLGDEDLFQRKSPDDNEYFDMVKSLGFDINIKNLAGLNAGKFFLESKTGGEPGYYRTSMPIVDFSSPQNQFSLGEEEMEEIKAIWPFVPRVSIEFEPGEELRIERNFNIELQSITIKAGGEYTFETGW